MVMTVTEHSVVSIEYELSNEQGMVLYSNKGFAALEYVHGAGNIVPAVEAALAGCKINETRKISVAPGFGFGLYDDTQVFQLPLNEYQHTGFVNVHDTVQLPDGREAVITAANDHSLTADANHPLAGQTLYYEVTVKNVRTATAEEINSGHPLAVAQACSGRSGCC